MRLSPPVHQLKRRARLAARNEKIALHAALDRIARGEGFASWSLLAAQFAMGSPSKAVLSGLADGELFLLGARPGHGKTLLGLQLLLDVAREGRKAVFFTLEYTERETLARIRSLDANSHADKLEIVASDEISADYVIRYLSGSARGTVAIVDYLQILDQQRSKPALDDQLLAVRDFARATGVVLGFIAQIDRSFDPEDRSVPDLRDIRLPNPVDLRFFTRACFLHNGEARLQDVA